MFSIDALEKTLKKSFKKIKKDQSDILAFQIAANFTAGNTAASKHQSIQSAEPEEDEALTDDENAAIAVLVATYLAYLSKFNSEAQKQILGRVKELINGGREEEVKGYLDDVFEGRETITIDNVGKKKKEIYVDKDLKLSEVSKTIEKPYVTSILSYAAMLGSTVSHVSYEAGRKAQYQRDGNDRWVFVGPADERARPHHVALIGSTFEWNTTQSEYAERVLQEPRCRHRSYPYFGDSRDTKKEVWDRLKEKNGLFWDESSKMWKMK
jgi:hypothetical protein